MVYDLHRVALVYYLIVILLRLAHHVVLRSFCLTLVRMVATKSNGSWADMFSEMKLTSYIMLSMMLRTLGILNPQKAMNPTMVGRLLI